MPSLFPSIEQYFRCRPSAHLPTYAAGGPPRQQAARLPRIHKEGGEQPLSFRQQRRQTGPQRPAATVGDGIQAIGTGFQALGDGIQAVIEQQRGAKTEEHAFDVGTAIALAGCAFESYNEPAGVAEAWKEWAVSGTYTTYVDRNFMKETLTGILEVHLKSATGLPARDLWGTSDPYCVVSVGGSARRSRVVPRCLDPVWDEKIQLYVRNPERQRLTIKCFDEDSFTADDSLGYTMMPVQALCNETATSSDLDLELQGDGGGGHVHLSVSYSPFTDAMAEEGEAHMGEDRSFTAVQGLTSGSWRALAEISGRTAEELYDPLCFIENSGTDTQVWVFRNAALKCLCIAFRGTEQIKWKDLLTDLSFQPAPYNPERVFDSMDSASLFQHEGEQVRGLEDMRKAAERLFQAVLGNQEQRSSAEQEDIERAANREPWVHEGFLKAYDSVRSRVLGVAGEVLGEDAGAWHVYVTGHSLGGALATLCSYELANRRYRGGGKPALTMYNYGSPRVGNAAYARLHNAAVPDSWRITNRLDVIPRVPRLMGYCHVGNSVSVTPDGAFDLNDARADVFKEGHNAEDVVPDLVAAALRAAQQDSGTGGENEAAEARLAELVAHELELWGHLVSGSALSEHMEEFYLDTLRALATAGGSVTSVAQTELDKAPGQDAK